MTFLVDCGLQQPAQTSVQAGRNSSARKGAVRFSDNSTPYSYYRVKKLFGNQTLGDLAIRAGCNVQTVRYYESRGLLPEPARSDGNYRLYGEPHVERLMFIRNCRALDMTLGEIRVLLGFKDDGGQDCGEVDALLDQHIDQVAGRIAKLQRLEAQLRELRQSCGERRSVEECAILQVLTAH